MPFNIKFNKPDDPVVEQIRLAARSKGWTGMMGFKSWAQETYNAKLNFGKYGDWNSITFKSKESLDRFRRDFSIPEPLETDSVSKMLCKAQRIVANKLTEGDISKLNLASPSVQQDVMKQFTKIVVGRCVAIYSAIDNGNEQNGTKDYLKALHQEFKVL